MTTSDAFAVPGGDRLLETLQRLLAIQALELRPALTDACTSVAEVLGADKVDVFLYERASTTLVAMGTSETPMGRRQHELGLNRQPLANGGPAVRTFETGAPYLTGRADQDPDQLKGMIDGLDVRSEMDVPLNVNGEQRGIIQVASAQPDRFTERDLAFLGAVSGWMGMLAHRSELYEQVAAGAVQQGRRIAAEEIARITRREREVAVLIAAGLTNGEIARRLVLVEGTVANHVEHILRKLHLRSRTQVAVWAVEHGLYRLGEDEDEVTEQAERDSWRGRTVGEQSQSASGQPGSETPA